MPLFAPVIEPPSWPATEFDDAVYTSPTPTDTGDLGSPDIYQLAVKTIGTKEVLGEFQCRIESMSQMLDGSGSLRAVGPSTNPSVMYTVGDPDTMETWNGVQSTTLDKVVDRWFLPVHNGGVMPPYVGRGVIDVARGEVVINAPQAERVFADRIIGTATRIDYLEGRGSFEGSTDPADFGVVEHGTIACDIANNGAHGARCLRIRGNPLAGHVTMTAVVSSDSVTGTQQVSVRAGAFVKLPSDAEDDVTVMEVYTRAIGYPFNYYPPANGGNEGAANVETDMPRGEWIMDPLSTVGLLPPPPYDMYVTVHLYPQSTTQWTYFDDVQIYRRDSLGTGAKRDLTYHLRTLINDAQNTDTKSTWGLTPVIGTMTGVSELGVWRHEDDQPLPDAFEALAGRDDGPELPWITGDFAVHCSATRGIERTDIVIGPDDILNPDGWSTDPGNVVTSMRGMTDRGTDYWRIESEFTNTAPAGGQVIERYLRAPNGMSLNAVDAWTRAELAQHSQPQDTTRVLVRAELGYRVEVGDRVRVHMVDGHLRLSKVLRCYGRTILPPVGLVALDFGGDER